MVGTSDFHTYLIFDSSRSPISVAIQPLWDVGTREFKIGKNKGTEILMRLQEVLHPEIFSPPGAYDGKKNLFSFKKYHITAQQFTVPWEGGQPKRPKDVSVKIVFVKQIDVRSLRNLMNGDPQSVLAEGEAATALNMLNLYVQSTPRMQDPRIHNAKSFFTPTNKRASDRIRPVELWRGYFQSVRPTFDRLLVNIDVTIGVVIPKGKLEQICADYLRVRNMREVRNPELGRLRLFLKGVKVEVDLPGHAGKRPRTIKDVVSKVGEIFFEKGGDRVSVADHFKRAHGVTIRPGSLGVKIGQDGLFPIDVCRTIQQLLKSRASPEIVREALDFSPPNPIERLNAIRAGWQQLRYAQSPFLLGAGISVKPEPLIARGRILPPPEIGFKTDKISLHQKRGQWDVMRQTLYFPAVLSNWAVVDFAGCDMKILNEFVRDLGRAMMERGMTVKEPHSIVRKPANYIKNVLEELARDAAGAQMLLVILPESAADIYRQVKRFGDITNGVVTQCVKWSGKLARDAQNKRCNQYHNNLILKINAKLGGLNCRPISATMAKLREVPTMVMGADVSHPAPGSMLPSIASLVASMDADMLRYVASIRVQETRTEMIQDLAAMFKAALITFRQKNNNYLPLRIMMFRDGVSEGEFMTVRDMEVDAMTPVVLELYQNGPKPELTFIVVGKRHHFRFFPMDNTSADSRGNGNLYPGFVVDRDITHPVFQDFYLQSQPGLKGTSRPSHYTVLKNNSHFTMDDLQQMAYALCHCYSRSTRAVKIPAPVYYADLVCRRAKFHFDDKVRDDASSEHSDEKPHLDFYKEHFEAINGRLKDMMYFV
ncbi:Protein argonaute-2 [Hypsizygus marmoreus]|uniref:Protein argonaute-2 n=1 Tax=Hypsizygus marmoreus TaxID=39966 RepID=A0A369JJF5_HYPMA|nr:Protein argonaute-2 [Hypsizygus marmoreus]